MGVITASDIATLPAPRGELSAAVVAELAGSGPAGALPLRAARRADPFGADLALALHTCYELHYRGFRGVDPGWEWDPRLLELRRELERTFLEGLRAETEESADVLGELDQLLVEPIPGSGVSHFLRDEGAWWQVREFFAHRSIYHLKEADPHAWVIPRLRGRAKAALVAVEFDEFGGGRGERVHAQLFADLLADAGMDPGYLHYLDVVPEPQLAIVNLMSLFGLHRQWRGALVGHFSAAEITTAPSAQRMARGCGGWGRVRRACGSSPSTSRRMRCTSRSCAGMCWGICWIGSRSWLRTWCSGSGRRTCWRAAWPSTS